MKFKNFLNVLKRPFVKMKIFPNQCMDCPVRGCCCKYGVIVGGIAVMTHHACQYLDEKTGLCKIYETRFEDNPKCLDMKGIYEQGGLPVGCKYLDIKPYKKKGKLKYLEPPEWLDEKSKFDWEIFNDSHRDFLDKYIR